MSRSLVSLLALLLTAGAAAGAGAEILSIATLPADPTDRDEVRLVITGRLPDGCWKADASCEDLKIRALDEWDEGVACLLVLVPYEFTCDLGRLAAGAHGLQICEERDSKRDPGTVCLLFPLSVRPAEQGEPGGTWGALKAIYR